MSIPVSCPTDDRNLTWFLTDSQAEQASPDCRICFTKCTSRRRQHGATSWSMAMAGRKVIHDRHECPHRDHPLHEQIVEHWHLAEALPDGRLKKIATLDLEDARKRFWADIARTDS